MKFCLIFDFVFYFLKGGDILDNILIFILFYDVNYLIGKFKKKKNF